MDERNRVLSPANGPLSAKLMFIGEAPGRLGADATQIPFHGDKAGDNFERLIAQVGISRYDCFVTNAILCNPRNSEGNNAPPSRNEIGNCASFLQRQIELIDPKIIVTLGANSLYALELIESHGLKLAQSVRRAVPWNGRLLIPLYHPGQRAMIHRSFLNQLADYQFVAEKFRRGTKGSAAEYSPKNRVDEMVRYCVRALLKRAGHIPYFQLHKLYYLLEYSHFRATGKRLSRAYIIRQKDGPYVTDLHVGSLRRSMDDLDIRQRGPELVFSLRESPADLFFKDDISSAQNKQLDTLIDAIWLKYGSATNEQLKTAVYLTAPMRALLRSEKYAKQSTFNQPLEFG
jgi:uracil-DNA glycosylase family 4